MSIFSLKKKRKGSAEQKDADTTPPALEDSEMSGTGVDEDHPSQHRSESAGNNAGHNKRANNSQVPNPREVIIEGIASQWLTTSKTNTALKIAVVALALSSLLSSMFAYTAWQKDIEYRYFFMGANGQLLENKPVSEPAFSLNMIRDFYAESLSHLFSFHYNNFDMHYQRLGPDVMTDRAMIEFANELDRIGLTKDMIDKREVAEAVINQVPVLLSSDLDPNSGAFTWELSVPINIRLESGLSTRNNVRQLRGVARVQIIRVPPTVHPRQFLINRITIGDRG